MSSAPIRVLVVDDSKTARETLETLLALDRRIAVVGHAGDGLEAVSLAHSLRPDVVTMDLLMPRLDGIEAIRRIMAEAPTRIVVVSSLDTRELDLSFRALEAGALEVIAKADAARRESPYDWAQRAAEAIVLMATVPVVRHRTPQPAAAPVEAAIKAFGLVASMGGPPALARILGALPPDLSFPLLVVQHVAVGFGEGLARWLQGTTRLPVRTAVQGTRLDAGHVYLAPDTQDLEVDDGGLVLRVTTPERSSPSGDRLLLSLARVFRSSAGGAVLTGMGSDGARGLLALRKAGGVTFAQDETSSAVYGMPRAAKEIGAAQEIRSVEGIAAAIRDLGSRGRARDRL
jgi:two-component system chemotaxis response regulator CheB